LLNINFFARQPVLTDIEHLQKRRAVEPDPLGEWFRRSRPNEPFPAWLHNDCVIDPSEDPGHEQEWKKARQIEDPDEFHVDFLLHLIPLESGAQVPMPELSEDGGDAGWFSNPNACRVPEKIPLGIVAHDADGAPKKADPDAVHPNDVFQYTRKFARSALEGGPVELRVDALQQLFRLPWFCHVWSAPQVKVELPEGAAFDAGGKIPDVQITRSGDTLRKLTCSRWMPNVILPGVSSTMSRTEMSISLPP